MMVGRGDGWSCEFQRSSGTRRADGTTPYVGLAGKRVGRPVHYGTTVMTDQYVTASIFLHFLWCHSSSPGMSGPCNRCGIISG